VRGGVSARRRRVQVQVGGGKCERGSASARGKGRGRGGKSEGMLLYFLSLLFSHSISCISFCSMYMYIHMTTQPLRKYNFIYRPSC
jgi:hypothetical protein